MPVTCLRKACVRPPEVAKIKIKIKSQINSQINSQDQQPHQQQRVGCADLRHSNAAPFRLLSMLPSPNHWQTHGERHCHHRRQPRYRRRHCAAGRPPGLPHLH
ncbi:hypothetical protein F7661_16480 [Pseudomonas sp. CFA]|nr:hypothetical protein F7661_16480 [Pseudomonas sp. CFA]